jgi:hypothetical protein
MPVTSHLGVVLGHDDQVSLTGDDVTVAAGANIRFARLIGLDGRYDKRSERGLFHVSHL